MWHEICAVNIHEETMKRRVRLCTVLCTESVWNDHNREHGRRAGVPYSLAEAPKVCKAVFDTLTHRGKHMEVLGSESQRLGNLSVWEKEAGHGNKCSISSTHPGF